MSFPKMFRRTMDWNIFRELYDTLLDFRIMICTLEFFMGKGHSSSSWFGNDFV